MPVILVAGRQFITEDVKESAVCRHYLSIDQFSADPVDMERRGQSHIGDAASLLNLREIVFQMLVKPIAHRKIVLIGNDKYPVGILLEGVRGQLPLDIRRQQEHERHRHREAHEVDHPV